MASTECLAEISLRLAQCSTSEKPDAGATPGAVCETLSAKTPNGLLSLRIPASGSSDPTRVTHRLNSHA